MNRRRYRLPSTSALQAFEAAARHCNFSHAAAELHTSQSAISRHVSALESRLDTSLFNRQQRRRLALTPQGEQFYRAVISGLDNIQASMEAIAGNDPADQLTIACTHEISHLFLLPRFSALQQALGADKTIRVMTYEYEAMDDRLNADVDIVLRYDVAASAPGMHAELVSEAVMPVVSPDFYRNHRQKFEAGIDGWRELPLLELSRRNLGWASWKDWLVSHNAGDFAPNYRYFNNYVYLLESAAAGHGIALGWRGLIERHLDSGVLRGCGYDYTVFERGIHALLTDYGSAKAVARDCIARLAAMATGS